MHPGGRAVSLLKQCRDCVTGSTFLPPVSETGDQRPKAVEVCTKGQPYRWCQRGVLIGWAYKDGSQLTRMEMASGPDASVLIVLSAFS